MMKKRHNLISLRPSASLIEAMEIINSNSSQIALVVDKSGVLLGTLTDGDIRRSLLKGETLNSSCDVAMNKEFHFFRHSEGYSSMQRRMKIEKVRQMPVLDDQGVVVDLVFLDEYDYYSLDNSVVLMAGGLGKRLMPYTENCPKPMLPVGGKPMLEILLELCIDNGFRKFYISVNYLKDQIIDYFGDGKAWGVSIDYLLEDEPLGTAGSLRLLPNNLKEPFLVMNGDVLTRLNLSQLLRFHAEHHAAATLCVREYTTTIPFGVVQTNGVELAGFEEKPSYRQLVNAGVYVIDPSLIPLLPQHKNTDMPTLLQTAQKAGHQVAVCPIHEYWIDVGNPEALNKAGVHWNN